MIPSGHRADEFSLVISCHRQGKPAAPYLSARFANEGTAYEIARDVPLSPPALATILKVVEEQTGANALKSPGLARLAPALSAAFARELRDRIGGLELAKHDAERRLEEARTLLAHHDAERPATCQCWNEGQYGRVHREDCPIHSGS